MKRAIFIFACVGMCLLTGEASAAVKYKRFPHCADGLVAERTCECRREGLRHFRYCHAGQYCHLLMVAAGNNRERRHADAAASVGARFRHRT
jgi:hypothetical protein